MTRDDRRIGAKEQFEGQGRVVLTASDNMQYAFEGEKVIGEGVQSLFTHNLINGLESGEADLDNDGEISLDELYDYVFSQVRDSTGKMTPGKWSSVQGQITIAKNRKWIPIDRLDKHLEKLYTGGLSAYYLEKWQIARQNFQELLNLRPDYRDVAVKLDETERQIELADQYSQAISRIQAKDWRGALVILETITKNAPQYKDTNTRLADVRERVRLDDLHAEAIRLHQAGQWQAVIKVFERIKNIRPDYPDPQGLLQTAKAELSRQEREDQLNTLYGNALQEMNAKRWKEARRLFQKIHAEEAEYRDTRQLLDRVNVEIASKRQKVPTQMRPPIQWTKLFAWVWAMRGFILLGLVVGISLLVYPQFFSNQVAVRNKLQVSVKIYIDGVYDSEIPAQSDGKIRLDHESAKVKFVAVNLKDNRGSPIGDSYQGEFQSVIGNEKLVITNEFDGNYYFFPILTNNTDLDCSIFVNDKNLSVQFSGILKAHQSNVVIGYYKWFKNSNVTLYCGENKIIWWGEREGTGDLLTVFPHNAYGVFTLPLNESSLLP